MTNTPTPTRMQRAGHALRTIPGRIFDALSPASGNDEAHEDVPQGEEEEEHGDAGVDDAEAESPAARIGPGLSCLATTTLFLETISCQRLPYFREISTGNEKPLKCGWQ